LWHVGRKSFASAVVSNGVIAISAQCKRHAVAYLHFHPSEFYQPGKLASE